MSKLFCLLLCVLCVKVVAGQDGSRFRRASGASSSTSSSGSFSGDGGFGGNMGGFGGNNGGFAFPQNFGFPSFGFPPFQDFNVLYQQFLASLQAAQAYAAANPSYAPTFQQQLAHLKAQQQAAMAQNPSFFYSGVDANTINPGASTFNPGANSVYTGASVNLGPGGGHGEAASFPGGSDGLGVRIAEEFPSPKGTFGVFTSSSSGTSDVNGKRTNFKTSTFGTNDNGKITFRTINE